MGLFFVRIGEIDGEVAQTPIIKHNPSEGLTPKECWGRLERMELEKIQKLKENKWKQS